MVTLMLTWHFAKLILGNWPPLKQKFFPFPKNTARNRLLGLSVLSTPHSQSVFSSYLEKVSVDRF